MAAQSGVAAVVALELVQTEIAALRVGGGGALAEARDGLGRMVASHHHTSISYRVDPAGFTDLFGTAFSEATTRLLDPRRRAATTSWRWPRRPRRSRSPGARLSLGRVIAPHHRSSTEYQICSSTSYQIREKNQHLPF